MAKTNGQKAQPKNSAKMWMGGTIRLVVKPELLADLAAGKSATIDFGTPGTSDWNELVLQVEAGPQNEIKELTPWFDLDRSILRIENSAAKDGPEYLQDYFGIYLEERKDRCLGFTINAKQGRALADVLLGYVRVCESIDALTAETKTA